MNNVIPQIQERLSTFKRSGVAGKTLPELIDARNDLLEILDVTYSEVVSLKRALRDGYMAMEIIDELERMVVASIIDKSAKDESKPELERLNHGFTD